MANTNRPIETKSYPCGTTATGTAPLPDGCPIHDDEIAKEEAPRKVDTPDEIKP